MVCLWQRSQIAFAAGLARAASISASPSLIAWRVSCLLGGRNNEGASEPCNLKSRFPQADVFRFSGCTDPRQVNRIVAVYWAKRHASVPTGGLIRD